MTISSLLARSLFSAALAIGLQTTSLAGFVSGNDLLRECNNRISGVCYAYVAAVVDYDQLLADVRHIPYPTFCIESGVTIEQLMDIVTIYLERHPEDRHYSAVSSVSLAITEKFTCRG